MRRMLRALTAVATALAILAVVAVGGAHAAAGGEGTITICVHHRGGGLYRSRGRCARHDFKLNWNAAGREGPAGSQGSQGPAGAQGPQGQPGPPGSALAWAQVGADGTAFVSGGTSHITVTHPSTGVYCVAVTPNPGFEAPVVANGTSPGEIVDVTPIEYATACPGAYVVLPQADQFNAGFNSVDGGFVVAVL